MLAPTTAPPAVDVLVVVPTYNGGDIWVECAAALAKAVKQSRVNTRVLVVDSTSRDASVDIARQHGFDVEMVASSDFDHGGTRNKAVFEYAHSLITDQTVVVFLTQDAVLVNADALYALIGAFDDPDVAVAYGRQLPHLTANPIAAHARYFNYPEISYVASAADAQRLGLKAVFTSNSFAAYRVGVFRELKGFPEKAILSEDMYFAARAVLSGRKVAYVAQAAVRHSHNYTPWEEFRRYFDIGVFHRDEAWVSRHFGGAGGEGKRFLWSQFRYLMKQAPWWLPRACVHNALKIIGYKLGKNYHVLPAAWRKGFSMHRPHWP